MEDILIKRDKFYIRFFMWVWDMGEEKLDQCRVFWGLLFFPIGLLINEKLADSTQFGGFVSGICLYGLLLNLILGGTYAELVAWITLVLFGLVFAGIGFLLGKVTIKKTDKAEKILNKITITGSVTAKKIWGFLSVLFYIPAKTIMFFFKIIVFFIKPVWKLIAFWISKLWKKFGGKDKTEGFFRFIINYVISFKEGHCRKIKLIN
jgi:hypothetical protein